jgi:DNA invertase Pin-like site-specific DNA recombinase
MSEAIGYLRVSTREQGRSGLGLAAQRFEIEAFGVRGGLAVKNKRDLILGQDSFYSGARGVLKVLAFMLEQGEDDELGRVIERQRRQINRIQGRRPRPRRH